MVMEGKAHEKAKLMGCTLLTGDQLWEGGGARLRVQRGVLKCETSEREPRRQGSSHCLFTDLPTLVLQVQRATID